MSNDVLALQQENQRLREALKLARPFVINPNQPFTRKVIDTIDAALALAGAQPQPASPPSGEEKQGAGYQR